ATLRVSQQQADLLPAHRRPEGRHPGLRLLERRGRERRQQDRGRPQGRRDHRRARRRAPGHGSGLRPRRLPLPRPREGPGGWRTERRAQILIIIIPSHTKVKEQARVRASETELKDKLVALNRVAKVTKGGRTFSFAAIVVVGDGEGTVGQGLGKARDVSEAIAKAIDDAKKNLVKVPIHKGTIPHSQQGKFGAGRVLIKPASDGTGVIAGGAMRAVLESAGVHNVLAKSLGSSNPHNVVKATINALTRLRSPQAVAKERRVSVEKVFGQPINRQEAESAE